MLNEPIKCPKPMRGRLESWLQQGRVMSGAIFDSNPPMRFREGDVIQTSLLTTNPPYSEGQIIETRNSMYLLGKPYGGPNVR